MNYKTGIKSELLELLGTLLALPVSVLISGLVIKNLWYWFVSAQFGVFDLTILQSAGLGMLLEYMVVGVRKSDKDFSWHNLFMGWTASFSGLLIGYLIFILI